MFIHDSIKIRYSDMGYLPGYPPHLISDAEMFDAFLREGGFFDDFYPCPYTEPFPPTPFPPLDGDGQPIEPVPSMYDEYVKLKQYISDTISSYRSGNLDAVPDWIYSYMLGTCISVQSDVLDLYYLKSLLGKDTTKEYPEFDADMATACFNVSYTWLKKQPTHVNQRPPSMFGEMHVVKSLRLDQANILID